MIDNIPYLKVFVSSPGDVNDERQIALDVIEQLPYFPTFRDKVTFRVVAWDKPGAGTALRGTLSPQEAIDKGLPKPSECDIVVVLFWSRIGTPFSYGGVDYLSGTHYEMMDALNSTRPETILYRRTEALKLEADDPNIDAKLEQYRKVKEFFNSDFFYADGKILRGVNQYQSPDDFRREFTTHMQEITLDILERKAPKPEPKTEPVEETINITCFEPEDWDMDKSPFPGLRAFTEEDRSIFFGRGIETDALVKQMEASRFVAVVGASGSGKSSLVGAGLIPRLRANAIPGSQDWIVLRFTPSDDVFIEMNVTLIKNVPELSLRDVLKANGDVLPLLKTALKQQADHVEILLFIDQFEELFTLNSAESARQFAQLLKAIAECDRVRAVVTMRHDFYHKAIEISTLAELFRNQAFSLSIPTRNALREMIEKPAMRAGITFEDGLVTRILDDTGDEPGNLALMAYALDELYKLADDRILTQDEYNALEGVQGAIGKRAENVWQELKLDDSVLQQVFHALVEVDERGIATRRREMFNADEVGEDVKTVVHEFTDARLLVMNRDPETGAVVMEVAHEAILRKWDRLADWVEATQDDHRTISRMKREAKIWDDKGQPEHMRPNHETLKEYREACMRLGMPDSKDKIFLEFTKSEQERLQTELDDLATTHARRYAIGERLNDIGDTRRGVGVLDNGIPDLAWCYVAGGGQIEIEKQIFDVKPFYIGKYLLTHAQFQAFVDDDYGNPVWWDGLAHDGIPEARNATNSNANSPRDSVSWYQLIAYCRWLSHKLWCADLMPVIADKHLSQLPKQAKYNPMNPLTWLVRLPTEWEWQWTAQNDAEKREYPWGDWDADEPRANTTKAGIQDRSTAVGMYPHGKAECGALDMAGNLWEWCLNEYSEPSSMNISSSSSRVLRGGAFEDYDYFARAVCRLSPNPLGQFNIYGVRLVVPIRSAT